MTDLAQIEQALTEARDALQEYWEQSEGVACFLALRLANDALVDYRALVTDGRMLAPRITALATEVEQLRAPLDAMPHE